MGRPVGCFHLPVTQLPPIWSGGNAPPICARNLRWTPIGKRAAGRNGDTQVCRVPRYQRAWDTALRGVARGERPDPLCAHLCVSRFRGGSHPLRIPSGEGVLGSSLSRVPRARGVHRPQAGRVERSGSALARRTTSFSAAGYLGHNLELTLIAAVLTFPPRWGVGRAILSGRSTNSRPGVGFRGARLLSWRLRRRGLLCEAPATDHGGPADESDLWPL